jgi:integrase
MARVKLNFTDNRLSKLTHDGSNKRLYFYDEGQSSLALCITPANTKSFQLQTWDKIRGKSISKTIGKYPAMAINDAREIVREYLTEIGKGEDVIAIARKKREEDCLDDVFERWLEYAKQKKRSWQHDKTRYYSYISKSLGKRRVSDIDRDTVRRWFANLTKVKTERGKFLSKTTANRVFAILRTVFNQELPDLPNPCKSIKQYQEYSRDRFLQPSELKQFFTALEHEKTPEYLKDYILLSLFTGARKSNVLGMKWGDIDFDNRIWTIRGEEYKNKSSMTIPLVEPVMDILEIRKVYRDSIFVFPSPGTLKSKTGHYTEPKEAWKELVKRAGLKDIRLHDLRRTMGSFQTIAGASLTIVGKALGHKSQAATAVYARLDLDPVRASMEKAVDLMLASKELPDKVVNIEGSKE